MDHFKFFKTIEGASMLIAVVYPNRVAEGGGTAAAKHPQLHFKGFTSLYRVATLKLFHDDN